MKLKYSCFISEEPYPFLSNYCFSFKNKEVSVFRSSLGSHISNPTEIQHWIEWLGSILWEDISASEKLFFLNSKFSDRADVLDSENEKLKNENYNRFRVIPLVDAIRPPMGQLIGISGQGTFSNDKIFFDDIREISRFDPWNRSYYFENDIFIDSKKSYLIDTAFEKKWIDLSDKCNTLIFNSPSKNSQLVEAYRSFEAAFFKDKFLEFKIPNLVRSIESIVALKKGEGTSKFVEKTIKQIGNIEKTVLFEIDKNIDKLLANLFQIRSDCVHGKPFAWTLKKQLGDEFNDSTVSTYEYLAEWVSRKVLENTFSNSKLIEACKDRDSLEEYW